jgi:hypothetical protein
MVLLSVFPRAAAGTERVSLLALSETVWSASYISREMLQPQSSVSVHLPVHRFAAALNVLQREKRTCIQSVPSPCIERMQLRVTGINK